MLLHRRSAAVTLGLISSLSGCSCGDGTQLPPEPTEAALCVGPIDSTECEADGTSFDWGEVSINGITTTSLRLANVGTAPLRIDSVTVTSDVAGGEYAVRLCDGSCDDTVLSPPLSVPAGKELVVELTLDSTDIDGAVPAEALEIVSNSPGDTEDPIGVYRRPFEGIITSCRDGYVDANMDLQDGCECEVTVDQTEYCDGVDNDCDGVVDEDVAGTGIACETALPGECTAGTTQCNDGVFECVSNILAEAEVCDGLDNDCDGLVDEENTWAPYDDGLSGANVTRVVHDPRTAGVAYMLAGDKLYRSIDSGLTFIQLPVANTSLNELAFPPTNPNELLAATGNGLQRSIDDGLTWMPVSLNGFYLFNVMVHPADANQVYVGTQGGGILRSTDGGVSFTAVNNGVPFSRTTSIIGDLNDPDRVVASLITLNQQGSFSEGVIVTTDNGGSGWTTTLSGILPLYDAAACATNTDVMYAASFGNGLHQSLDGGETWSQVNVGGTLINEVAVAPSNCNAVYASVYPLGIYRSSDGAQAFTGPLATGIDSEQPRLMKLSVDPSDSSRVLGGNHSGVFLTNDSALNWTRVSGIQAVLTRSLSVAADGTKVFMSTWGQGLWEKPNVGSPWAMSSSLGRDYGFMVQADPYEQNRIFVGGWPEFAVSNNGGTSFTEPLSGPSNTFAVAFHPTDAQVVYAGSQLGGIWKSGDGGTNWVASDNGLPSAWDTGTCICQDTRAVLVDQNTPSTVYAGTNLMGFFRSTDDGATWQAAGPELDGETVHCLVQSGSDIYACVAGKGVWRSTDSGTSFSHVSQGMQELTDIANLFVAPDGEIFAASDEGVFRSKDGTNWSGIDNQCLPPFGAIDVVTVDDNGARRAVVGTYGAGMYSLPL